MNLILLENLQEQLLHRDMDCKRAVKTNPMRQTHWHICYGERIGGELYDYEVIEVDPLNRGKVIDINKLMKEDILTLKNDKLPKESESSSTDGDKVTQSTTNSGISNAQSVSDQSDQSMIDYILWTDWLTVWFGEEQKREKEQIENSIAGEQEAEHQSIQDGQQPQISESETIPEISHDSEQDTTLTHSTTLNPDHLTPSFRADAEQIKHDLHQQHYDKLYSVEDIKSILVPMKKRQTMQLVAALLEMYKWEFAMLEKRNLKELEMQKQTLKLWEELEMEVMGLGIRMEEVLGGKGGGNTSNTSGSTSGSGSGTTALSETISNYEETKQNLIILEEKLENINNNTLSQTMDLIKKTDEDLDDLQSLLTNPGKIVVGGIIQGATDVWWGMKSLLEWLLNYRMGSHMFTAVVCIIGTALLI